MSQYPASPTGADPARPADGLAIASLICGILGLVGMCGYGLGILPAIAGLICGLMSKTKGGIRTAGIICSSIAIGLCVLAIILLILGVGLMALGGAAQSGANP
ncbi:MAG: hypothetical protein Q8L55_04175 [Phycisphaerales bacterium]|nr:hypothetical protein [Phycisphaerales bacterium]